MKDASMFINHTRCHLFFFFFCRWTRESTKEDFHKLDEHIPLPGETFFFLIRIAGTKGKRRVWLRVVVHRELSSTPLPLLCCFCWLFFFWGGGTEAKCFSIGGWGCEWVFCCCCFFNRKYYCLFFRILWRVADKEVGYLYFSKLGMSLESVLFDI